MKIVLGLALISVFLFFPLAGEGQDSRIEKESIVASVTTPAGNLTHPRRLHAASLLNSGEVLITGGDGIQGLTAELYDPVSRTFSMTGSMTAPPHTREGHTSTLLEDGTVLVAGGRTNAAELYDPATGTFTRVGDMARSRYGAGAMLLSDGRVLFAGGAPDSNLAMPLRTVEIYDPVSRSFSTAGTILEDRVLAVILLLSDGRVLLAGGKEPTGPPIGSAEVFDPSTGVSAFTGSLVTPRLRSTGNLLPDGSVLVFSGEGTLASRVDSAELYSPSGTFGIAGIVAVPRRGHRATSLSNGNVVITGGFIHGEKVGTFEVYDVGTGSIRTDGELTLARDHHTATLLKNGQILIAGGAGQSTNYMSSAELYGSPSPTGRRRAVRRP
jgi:hypothetical protein